MVVPLTCFASLRSVSLMRGIIVAECLSLGARAKSDLFYVGVVCRRSVADIAVILKQLGAATAVDPRSKIRECPVRPRGVDFFDPFIQLGCLGSQQMRRCCVLKSRAHFASAPLRHPKTLSPQPFYGRGLQACAVGPFHPSFAFEATDSLALLAAPRFCSHANRQCTGLSVAERALRLDNPLRNKLVGLGLATAYARHTTDIMAG